MGIAVAGIANGWLGPWGYLIWVPMTVLGLIFVCFVGHFLIFEPIGMFVEYVKRKNQQ